MKSVVIIGGGLAGLASACALAERGMKVTLLESRPRLGGRASSFADAQAGETIDNCQHVTMGCCTNYLHFCKTIGVADRLQKQRELYFIDTHGELSRFVPSSWLPAPLHLVPALRGLRYFNRHDRAKIARTMKSLAMLSPGKRLHRVSDKFLEEFDLDRSDWGNSTRILGEEASTLDFFNELEMPEHLLRKYWHVVLVSALSESLENISLAHTVKVFVDGFLKNKTGWEVSIPTVPLDELYGTELQSWLQSRGAEIRLNAGVAQFEENEFGNLSQVRLRDDSSLTADQFIVAVPWNRVAGLFSPFMQTKLSFLEPLEQLRSAPISSVHLWFDREITELPHAVFVDHFSQWMFNRSRLLQKSTDDRSHYYQIVISNSRELNSLSQEQIVENVRNDLTVAFPQTAEANLLHSRVVTEHKAVFSPRPGSEKLRPTQRTSLDNLHLAGDWTKTGWPATMEGAVRSGYLAAESVLESLGETARVLQPDLPATWLARRVFGFDR